MWFCWISMAGCWAMPPIDVIGMGADGPAGLRPEVVDRIRGAEFLAGGERHLEHFPSAQTLVVKNNLPILVEELQKRQATQRCVVLASGDPLFYGIGTYLIDALGSSAVRIEPAVSSMQWAFARAGTSWQNARLGSIHGRDVRAALLPLLGVQKIGLFTNDGDSPGAVARFFLDRGLGDYEAVVGEHLGAATERITRWETLEDLAHQRFDPLNYLILLRRGSVERFRELDQRRGLAPGIPDREFERPVDGPEVMTRQEVRAVLLSKIGGWSSPGDVVWDVGAGLGTVSVEIALWRPHLEVVAAERNPERAAFLRKNRERFGTYNIRVLEGSAPEILKGEAEKPAGVFVGGSGEYLADILDLIEQRLRVGGRLLANVVTLEHLTLIVRQLKEWRWAFEVTEIHVARSDDLAGLTGLKPQRGVFLVAAEKGES
jgi:precorrin-6Y C5,15-methyltransferase (decarboxylating)